MRERILYTKDRSEVETAERCYLLEMSNSLENPDVSIARARVKPAVTTALHRLRGIDERYIIIEGRGRVEVGEDLTAKVSQGDVVWIPRTTGQQVANVGSSDLVFLCICTLRFSRERYDELEAAR